MRTSLIALALSSAILAISVSSSTAADDPGIAFFETKIRPVLVKECYS